MIVQSCLKPVLALTLISALTACAAVGTSSPPADAPESRYTQQSTNAGAMPYQWQGSAVAAETLRMRFQRKALGGAETGLIFGDGVLIANTDTQYWIDHATVQALLDVYQEAGFKDMQDEYGEDPIRIHTMANLVVGEFSKQVFRTQFGTGKDPLRPMVGRLFELIHPLPEAGGVVAETLHDGLEKIVAGRLSPRALKVSIRYKPDAGKGWLLRAWEGRVDWHTIAADGNMGSVEILAVDDAWRRQLAQALLRVQVADLPRNIFEQGSQTQIVAKVLDKRHTVVAREFAGKDRQAQAELHARLEDLLQQVAALQQTAVTR